MRNAMLYIITVVVWGSTWLAIKYQLGMVDPMVSVIYRFGLAAIILILFCAIKGLQLKFSLKEHFLMALLGILLFSVNYWLIYVAEIYITSGLMAVLFSSIVFLNIANGSIFLGAPMDKKMFIGAMVGIIGITLIFMPEIQSFDLTDKGLFGILIGLISVLLASLGNITSAFNSKKNIPIIQANAFGMAYGSLFLAGVAMASGREFTFALSFPYISSLVYLAVFGSIVGFGCYLSLIDSLGPDKAAYAIMLVPLVALILSSFFEGYTWSYTAVAGLILVLGGNFLALKKPKPALG